MPSLVLLGFIASLGLLSFYSPVQSFLLRKSNLNLHRKSLQSSRALQCITTEVPLLDLETNDDDDEDDDDDEPILVLTENARNHLNKLRKEQDTLFIRMGVRSGGCSGMSYVMDLMKEADIEEEDHVEIFDDENMKCVIDPKSLLYLYGLQLDYSDELIGGGFKFSNPNAETNCGCGKSFGV